MSQQILFANNDNSTLAGAITNTATTAQLAVGTGILFPSPGSGQYFVMTFISASTPTIFEIVHVTNVTGDTITIVRGQEGTTPTAFNPGDIAAGLITAGALASFQQAGQAQAQAGNYAVDTGTANSYVCALTPAVTSAVVGMPIRVLIAHSSTGASTFNPGSGSQSVVDARGNAISSGEIVGGTIVTFIWNGSAYQANVLSQVGTVTSVGIADATNGGLSVSGSPITGSGTIGLALNPSDLLTKASPTTSDSVVIMDAAASNAAKTSLISALSSIVSPSFVSSAYSVPSAGTTLTVAHGLSAAPNLYQMFLVCITGENGWSTGNVINFGSGGFGGTGVGDEYNFVTSADATNVYVIFVSEGDIETVNKSTGATVALTAANWNIVIAARV